MYYKHSFGAEGERFAQEHYEEQGYRLVAKNFRTLYGEIDLIFKKGTTLYFVEVKTRTSDLFGFPEESVTGKKLEHLRRSAQYYLAHENSDRIRSLAFHVCAVMVSGNGIDITVFDRVF